MFKLAPFYAAIFTAFEDKSALFSRRITTNNKTEYKGMSNTFVFFFLHLCLAAFRKNIYKTRNRRSAQRLSEALEKVSVTYVELGLLHVDQGLSKLMKSRLVNYGLSVMATLCFPLQRTQKNLIDVTAHTWKKRPFIDNNLINEFLISFTKMFSADVDLSIFLQGNP